MAWTLQDAAALHGLPVVDPEGERIGRIEDVYFDRATGRAEWATVKTALFGSQVNFIPIGDAHPNFVGDIVVHVPREEVRNAPRIEPGDALTPEQERELYEYYGVDHGDWDGRDHTEALGLPPDQAPAGTRLRRLVVVAVPADPAA